VTTGGAGASKVWGSWWAVWTAASFLAPTAAGTTCCTRTGRGGWTFTTVRRDFFDGGSSSGRSARSSWIGIFRGSSSTELLSEPFAAKRREVIRRCRLCHREDAPIGEQRTESR
jgi:hypothetical protein